MFKKVKNLMSAFVEGTSKSALERKLNRLEKRSEKIDLKMQRLQHPEVAEFLECIDLGAKTLHKIGSLGPASKKTPMIMSDALLIAAVLSVKPTALTPEQDQEATTISEALTKELEYMSQRGLTFPEDFDKIVEHASGRIKAVAKKSVLKAKRNKATCKVIKLNPQPQEG